MHVVAAGLNHNTAPVDLRETLAVAPPDIPAVLTRLRLEPGVDECCVLSTCNRTELYVACTDPGQVPERLTRFLAGLAGIPEAQLRGHLYARVDLAAAEHLFRVAAGLDAMVLGETQILGQVRDAYLSATGAGTAGKTLHHLLAAALAAGKRAQAETGIGQNAVSISYAAVELVKKLYQGLQNRTILAIGAGETAKLTVRHLIAAGAKRILVANRTMARAERLAAQVSGQAIALEAVGGALAGVDVVISSTGAPGYVLTRAMLQEALRLRRGRPIFLFDIAVPRDIDPTVGRLEGAFLYDIDDLKQVVSENLEERTREALRAERILAEELQKWQRWMASQDVVPTIRQLRDKVESIRSQEFQRALFKLPDLTERQRAIIEAMTQSMVNKILNDPTQRLKGLAAAGDAGDAAAAMSLLFDLNPPDDRDDGNQPTPAALTPSGEDSAPARARPGRNAGTIPDGTS